ncbi:GNAT family N-acetyltransferase [Selenomonas sp. FC4001]|uniref:GNAT family N-acetyltransferase n=1 Tax=Selenomonas sp. FC4001 TaxID=1408313 RepID=UPI000561788E|nr:GNAT family N-acetyltransferase [Selenomonas sp. FC4001]
MNSSVSDKEIAECGSVFEQPWWLDVVALGQWNEITVNDKNGNCIGRLPYVKAKKYGMDYLGLPVLTQHVGPWFKLESNMKSVATLKRVKQVSEEFIRGLETTPNVDLYFHHSAQYVLPFIWAGYNVEPKFTYVIDNLENLDSIFQGMESKVRNLIKNAGKKYFITDNVSEDDLVRLVGDTFKKQGRDLPMGETVLRRLYREAFEHNAGKIIGAVNKESGQVDSVAFFLYDKHSCYYLLGGKDYEKNTAGAQEAILWEGIKFAATVSKVFDFEGSMIPGIESFFRGFGGTPKVYYRIWRGGIVFKLLNRLKPKIKKILGYK